MNFIDKITYSPDTSLIIPEVELKFPEYIIIDEDGNKTLPIIGTPLIKNGKASLSYTRDRVNGNVYKVLSQLDSLEVLGSYEEVFADEEKHDKYKSVYPYHIPVEYEEINDEPQSIFAPKAEPVIKTYLRPQKLGSFAGTKC